MPGDTTRQVRVNHSRTTEVVGKKKITASYEPNIVNLSVA